MALWIYCKGERDLNVIVRPPLLSLSPSSDKRTLSPYITQYTRDYIYALSYPLSHTTSHTTTTPSNSAISPPSMSPLVDGILIIYLDGVSRKKFHHFYPHTMKILQSLSPSVSLSPKGRTNKHTDTHPHTSHSHRVYELSQLHSLGINSEKNYPQLFAGVGPMIDETKIFFHKLDKQGQSNSQSITDRLTDRENRREPWLFDLAESLGYETLSGTSGCYQACTEYCYDRQLSFTGYEIGGYYKQYMGETHDRMPALHSFPASLYCENGFRERVREKGTVKGNNDEILPFRRTNWAGNRLSMDSMLDYWRISLSSYVHRHHTVNNNAHSSVLPPKRHFGAMIFEETHGIEHFTNYDHSLSLFLQDILLHNNAYKETSIL